MLWWACLSLFLINSFYVIWRKIFFFYIIVSPCDNNPCENNGTCSVDINGNATCTCDGNWNGTYCQGNFLFGKYNVYQSFVIWWHYFQWPSEIKIKSAADFTVVNVFHSWVTTFLPPLPFRCDNENTQENKDINLAWGRHIFIDNFNEFAKLWICKVM